MKPTIVVCGYGPGISNSVARKFGKEGFAVALVARDRQRLSSATASLGAAGVTAKAFPCDLGSPSAVRALMAEVRASLGPVAVLHWNAYAGLAGDLTTADTDELRTVLDVSVHGLVAGVQAALPDLKATKGAVLVTGGGLAFYDDAVDAMAVQWGSMGLAIGKAAQHKLVGVLHHKLASDGIYVGEVVVRGLVKGTAFDKGQPDTIDPAIIADKFWDLHQRRTQASVSMPA
jgi:NADP-dependent 3-hydroxy acid dehydrogenase YdfG